VSSCECKPSGTTAGGLFIPAGLVPATSGPTKSDGIYKPNTNREIYQKISSDYQEIAALTNQLNEGRPQRPDSVCSGKKEGAILW
jgi:hypothetical protein